MFYKNKAPKMKKCKKNLKLKIFWTIFSHGAIKSINIYIYFKTLSIHISKTVKKIKIALKLIKLKIF